MSFGSLKTEEKTERQCGQFVREGPVGNDRVLEMRLSVNSAIDIPCRWQHGYRPVLPHRPQSDRSVER
jgi:hypothetical protein